MKNQINNTQTVLVLANEALDGEGIVEAIRCLVGEEPRPRVLVVAPALNSRLCHWVSDEDDARRDARARLESLLEELATAGIEAEGIVGDADPLQAIDDALYEFSPAEIVIATRREGRAHWLARDLVARARRRFAEPVVHVAHRPREANA